ncbi:PAS domain-containing protein [Kineosporia sp. J2-2]|uniref:PAS domain-containing protein n=1 Tax=Kineosporia corallincola TaxID=2835133 RepID=A0ABS5THD1_9ACTN|nr:PAS domain-containing protein [Kineosporia corallincola]MBT0770502.1 PAS domain-containing protein [Kineosporia corallincola]
MEHVLGRDELIVSKTDTKGILTYVNETFCRLAVADEIDLIGKPHNVIRHPDMPRAIFKYLWETIAARKEVFAYVKNMGMDGSFYWVFAHVTASGRTDGQVTGYHSNRRAPGREAINAIEPLYRELCRIEQSGGGSRQGLDASTAALNAELVDRGLSYDEFIWSITP